MKKQRSTKINDTLTVSLRQNRENVLNDSFKSAINQTLQRTSQRAYMVALHRQIFTNEQSQEYEQKVQKVAKILQKRFDNAPLRSIIIQLYKFVITRHKISPRDRCIRHMAIPQLYLQPRRGRKKIVRKQPKPQAHPNHEYLHNIQLPPYIPIDNEDVSMYSVLILTLPQEIEQKWWRVQQLRVLADVYSTTGYGLAFVRMALNQHCMGKDRFKSLMGTIIRQCIRSIQDFLLSHQHTIIPLRLLSPRFINTLLLNVKHYFPRQSAQIFTRAVRINCALQEKPIPQLELLAFYQTFVVTLNTHFDSGDLPKEDAEAMHVQVKITELGIWGEQQDRYLAERYLQGAKLKEIQEELAEDRPELAETHYSCLKVRRRLFKIIRATIRKGNLLMLDSGLPEEDIASNEQEIKKLMRSPEGYTVRLHLCRLFLNEDQSPAFVHQLHKLLQDYRNGELPMVRDVKVEKKGRNRKNSRKEKDNSENGLEIGNGENSDQERDIGNLSQWEIDEDS